MRLKISFLILAFWVFASSFTFSQMDIGGQVLFGNEWINYDQSYYKINLEEDGLYRLSYQDLASAGLFSGSNTPTGSELKLYNLGKEIPIYVSTTGVFTTSDYVEFYGTRNRGEVDSHLYEDADHQLNPGYSLFTDVASYFLTWNADAGLRYDNIPNNLSNPPSVEAYCLHEEEIIFSDKLNSGRNYGSGSIRCSYDLGEGFSKNTFTNNQSFSIESNNVYSSGPGAELNVRLFSKEGNHDLSLVLNNTNIASDQYSSWNVKQFSIPVTSTVLVSGNNALDIIGSGSVDDDEFSVVEISLVYPTQFDFNNEDQFKFNLIANNSDRYLQINNFNHGGVAPILFDLTNKIRIETSLNSGVVEVVLPTFSGERELVLVNTNTTSNILSVEEREFINYDFQNSSYDYIMITHPYFFDDGNGNNLIQDYADYRASIQGGEYAPLIVDVTQIYDQFGYGIDRHEQSIKNYLKVAENAWSPKLLYLIGKGATYGLMRTNASEWEQFSFVPSFGYPSSDHLFVTAIGESSPSMGVGRLAVKSHSQLSLYFNKIIEYEAVPQSTSQTIEDKEWMKKFLHFGGGDAAIQNTIETRLNILKDTIETSTLGGEVTSFFKNSSNTVTVVETEEVVPLINKGALMLTFFGHSAPSTLDFDLGDPNAYENQGKYPLFYAIGCNTNRVFETENTLSEDFVFIENKGCIGFLGATWVTALGGLSQYAESFYTNLGGDNYGESIGEIIKATIDDYSFSNSYTAELLRNCVVLHGDPALKLYPFEAPDYIVKKDETSIEPSIINAVEDSFSLNLIVSNIGRSIEDSINIHLEHELPNGEIIDLGYRRVKTPYFNNDWIFNLPLINTGAIGLNHIVITLDSDDEVLEAPTGAELNNTERIPFFVVSNDIFPVAPYEFSIVSENPILKASTANAFSESLGYYFEIDTTERFNSPILESTVINQEGGVLEWEPSIQMLDSVVYYWRVSIDSTLIDGGFNWHNSSFIYLPNTSPGWNQSHFWQFTKDDYSQIIQDTSSYEFKFNEKSFKFNQVNSAVDITPWVDIHLFREGFRLANYFPCTPNNQHRSLWVLAYDPVTLELGQGPPGTPSFNCFGGEGYGMIRFPNIQQDRLDVMDFIENTIPDGYYVIFFTTQTSTNNYHADEWADDTPLYGKNIFNVLEEQGAFNVQNIITNQTPYICVFKKNDPSFPTLEYHADNINTVLDVEYFLNGIARTGEIYSTTIGPASEWETLLWNTNDYNPSVENANIDIVGIDASGNEMVLADSITNYQYALNSIDANQYPYLKLIYNGIDSIENTIPQLDYWRVHFTPIPEAALVPNKIFSFQSDTLQQGEMLTMEIGIENLGGIDMDSLLMNYTIIDAQNNQIVESERLTPLLVDDIITGQLTVDTRNLLGENQLIIEANPNDDQPELHHYNNIGVQSFFVQGDDRNPLLDVTFDGIHIMDGDLISSVPEIVITLLDENPYLALTDTALLRVFLTDPLGQTQEYEVDGDILTFYPATGNISDENKARMEFRPDLVIDGTYELQVRGKDESGNNSGDFDFKVNFEVINEETVSNVLNYPNPFSTSTQFVFTLTGNELPDVFRIQIMTVSGKIVKEIDLAELGPIHIGNNISDYRWDGTDEYGDKLANGVYLYRVMVKKDGENYESYDNGTNEFFKKGFGKMVILR